VSINDPSSRTQPHRILDVVAKYPDDPDIAPGGHHETYHSGLQAAARLAGFRWDLLVPAALDHPPDDAFPVLEPATPADLAASIRAFLSRLDAAELRHLVVLIYEGSRTLLQEIDCFASEWPDVRFVVNLFTPDADMDVPFIPKPVLLRHRRPWRTVSAPVDPNIRCTAPNIVVTAETEQRALRARSMGAQVSGCWRLHSALPPSSDAEIRGSDGYRVLLPLAAWQLDQQVFEHVRAVAASARVTGHISLHVAGMWKTAPLSRSVRNRLRRLERCGVDVEIDAVPPPMAAYQQRFLAADAVWLPKSHPYRFQSSGKALDALVSGRPVIAPAGTYPANEMRRWVPGMPTYGTAEEAVRLFAQLPSLATVIGDALRSRSREIQRAYSAEETISWLRQTWGG
jgi:hypothetical protein